MELVQYWQAYLKELRSEDLLIANYGIEDPLFRGIIAVLLGVSVGSFLNVMALRSLEEKSWFWPPSSCTHCGKRLGILDLIPVLSYLMLNGKCRHCKERISWHYPVVEVLTGCFFLAELTIFGWSINGIAMLLFTCTLIAVTVTDFREKLIPHEITYPSMLIGITYSGMVWGDLLGTMAGIGASYIIFDYIDFYGLILLKRIRPAQEDEDEDDEDEDEDEGTTDDGATSTDVVPESPALVKEKTANETLSEPVSEEHAHVLEPQTQKEVVAAPAFAKPKEEAHSAEKDRDSTINLVFDEGETNQSATEENPEPDSSQTSTSEESLNEDEKADSKAMKIVSSGGELATLDSSNSKKNATGDEDPHTTTQTGTQYKLDRNSDIAGSRHHEDDEEEIVMGGGDAVLAAVISAWLGWQKMVLAIFIAFLIGALMGAVYLFIDLKRRGELSRTIKPGIIGFLAGFCLLFLPMFYIYSSFGDPSGENAEQMSRWFNSILGMAAVGGIAGSLVGMIFAGSRFENRFPFGPAIAIGAIISLFINVPGHDRNMVPEGIPGHNGVGISMPAKAEPVTQREIDEALEKKRKEEELRARQQAAEKALQNGEKSEGEVDVTGSERKESGSQEVEILGAPDSSKGKSAGD